VRVDEDHAIVEERVFRMLPRHEQALDQPVYRCLRHDRQRPAHHARDRAAGRQQLDEALLRRRDESQFGPVRNVHVDEFRADIARQYMTVTGGVWIDAFDRAECVAFVLADDVGRIGIVASGQHNAAPRMERVSLAANVDVNADHATVPTHESIDPGRTQHHAAQAQQSRVECRNVGFGVGHDIMHARDAVGRLGARAVKRQSHADEPIERFVCVGEEEAAKRLVVARFDVGLREATGVNRVIVDAVSNAGLVLKPRASSRERADGDAGRAAESFVLFEQQHACAMLGRADRGGQAAAASADDDDVVRVHGESVLLRITPA
jgi:hypothetical protein